MGEHKRKTAPRGDAYKAEQQAKVPPRTSTAILNPGGMVLRRIPAAGGRTRLVWLDPKPKAEG